VPAEIARDVADPQAPLGVAFIPEWGKPRRDRALEPFSECPVALEERSRGKGLREVEREQLGGFQLELLRREPRTETE